MELTRVGKTNTFHFRILKWKKLFSVSRLLDGQLHFFLRRHPSYGGREGLSFSMTPWHMAVDDKVGWHQEEMHLECRADVILSFFVWPQTCASTSLSPLWCLFPSSHHFSLCFSSLPSCLYHHSCLRFGDTIQTISEPSASPSHTGRASAHPSQCWAPSDFPQSAAVLQCLYFGPPRSVSSAVPSCWNP